MKLVDLIDGAEEDEHLGLLVGLLIQKFEDVADDIFVHVDLGGNHLVVVPDSLKSYALWPQLFLNHFADVVFYRVGADSLVEFHELFIHCSWASHHIWSVLL